MLPIYIVALLVATASSLDIPCQKGVEIKSSPLKDADYMIGNWTYAYQWDIQNQFSIDPIDKSFGRPLKCPGITIEAATPDFINKKREECGTNHMPFKWKDAKLKINIPSLFFRDTVLFTGAKNWLLKVCKVLAEVKLIKVSDEVMVLEDQTVGVSLLMSRTALRRPELECLIHNIDVGKDIFGFGLCH